MRIAKNILIYFLKYFTLIFFFWILLVLTKSYGKDYSGGIVTIFLIPILFILMLINIIVLYILDNKLKKFKITNITLLILSVIFFSHLLIGYFNSNKEAKYNLILKDDYKSIEVKLFENNNYRIRKQYAEGSSYHTGKYSLKNNILELKDSVEKISNNKLTKSYNFIPAKKCFVPLNNKFDTLVIEN